VLDVGSGTGLLALAFAERSSHVWAIDSSGAMCEYLRVKAASAGLTNVTTALASAVSLPLVDASVDVVVSNYCMHELREADKRRALEEMMRVLRPGGRLVIGDMMFSLNPLRERDRTVVLEKVRVLAGRGLPGIWRLAKNAARLAGGRWESPADADWWREELRRAGFVGIEVALLGHEGGIASAYAPPAGVHGSASSEAMPGTVPSGAILASAERRRLRYASKNAVVTRSTIPS
jgi:SAM-dependent methyltransferase